MCKGLFPGLVFVSLGSFTFYPVDVPRLHDVWPARRRRGSSGCTWAVARELLTALLCVCMNVTWKHESSPPSHHPSPALTPTHSALGTTKLHMHMPQIIAFLFSPHISQCCVFLKLEIRLSRSPEQTPILLPNVIFLSMMVYYTFL